MATQRIKLDYNHLIEQIDSFLSDKSEDNDTFVFGMTMRLALLNGYMSNIVERAIELNDDVLIALLKDLCILKEKEGDE